MCLFHPEDFLCPVPYFVTRSFDPRARHSPAKVWQPVHQVQLPSSVREHVGSVTRATVSKVP